MALHEEQEGAEQTALLLAWEIGVRLNLAFEMLRKIKWGLWGKFLDEHCPDICRMTICRYRGIASFYNSVGQIDGMTLSEAYAEMKLAKFKEESDDGTPHELGKKKEEDSHVVKLFKKVTKLATKFDIPATLSREDTSTIRKAAMKLVAVSPNTKELLLRW